MELRHLRYFIAVAEDLHFGRAAERLHIAQQPLSRQIRDLETELGVELFYRTKRTVRLTEIGQAFLIEARKTLKQAEQAVLLAQRMGQGEIGRLAIGFTGPALNKVLPKIVRQFKQRHPKVELALERLQTNEQVKALRAGEIHAGLLHPPIDDDTLLLETIDREKLVVVLPDTHELAQELKPISLKVLANESFVLFPRQVGPVLYDQIIGLCQKSGFSPKIVQEVISQQTILGLVAVGIGITLIHASVQTVGQAGVVVRDLLEPTPELELAIAWSPTVTNPLLPSLLEIVREIVA
ncbi:LysR family transcriptional regulator [Leptolyngbya sp. FACHB-261]|uniref:LysR family transcriptional regulator n=1 Tax=Leptolyngbya sp. FACHB-261 TaxID=2692806 RepID=UPI001688C368|nr:LysR family transcriptional regulator [Leptolyngbya sp. FACHB-261]MBD2103695.1 LysR family transcriptional regulator [Leptolyngbya sp. FACHB-261]